MGKFILTESEKNEIKSLYKSKGLLFEQGEPQPDLPKVPNWDVAKEWVMSKTDKEPLEGVWPETDPEYYYAKYKNDQGNYMEIKSNGLAQEADSQYQLVHKGTWKWNGSEVTFSWLATKRAGDVWAKAKERLKKNGVEDYNQPESFWDQSQAKYSEGTWEQGGYDYAKLEQKINDIVYEIEIRDNFTWRNYNRTENDVYRSGKWSWDGSKIVFGRGVTKKSSGLFSNEDTDLYTAVMLKNKIGKIGARGPAVKELQYLMSIGPYEIGADEFGVDCDLDREKCDGIYGPKTKEAVKKVQSYYDIKVDGIFGKESYNVFRFNEDDESDID